jgi:2TM domain
MSNQSTRREEARRWVRRKRIFYTVVGIYLALSLMWFAIDLLDDPSGDWFYWPMLGTGFGVVVTGVVLGDLGGLFGTDWERREIERYLRRSGDQGDGPMPDREAASLLHAEQRAGPHGLAWAETVLREQGMPPDELRVVLSSADRELVRRHLELHLERLDERLASQKRLVEAVGRILVDPRDRQDARDSASSGLAVAG